MSEQEPVIQIRDERRLGYLMGFGLTLMILAGLLEGLGTIENNTTTGSIFVVGLALFLLGLVAWLAIFRPWHRFDDLKTPFYTGHHEEHADHAEPAAEAAAEAEPEKPEPVKSGVPATVPKTETAIKPHVIHAPAPKAQPAAAEAKPDDLTVIEGIGPKTNGALQAAGVVTFAKLAELSPEAISTILSEAKVRVVAPVDTWPRQAKLAAAGKMAELAALQSRIKGGIIQDD